MNNITIEELVCFTKVLSVFMGVMSPAEVSRQEKELAIEAMKKMAENRDDWTHEQKETYKVLADIVKEQSRH
jgi:hypothetical protein